MMRVSAKSNFSFKTLLNYIKSEEFQKDITSLTTKPIASSAKEVLKTGSGLKPLEKSTIAIRSHRGVGGTTPLYATGRLYNSIKATKKGLKMLKYGTLHNRAKGYRPKYIPIIDRNNKEKRILNKKGIRVPQRKFLSVDIKDKPKVESKIAQKFKERLKKIK